MVKIPSTLSPSCKECFYLHLENNVHNTITVNSLFKPNDRVAIAASGGKDSTVLAHVLCVLNKRHNYGLDLCLLSIDEGITGYRDDSLETVKRNEQQYGIPLKILSYQDLYGWTMDAIVKQIGLKNNCKIESISSLLSFNYTIAFHEYLAECSSNYTLCHLLLNPGTFCGVFRRQALDRGAALLKVDHIVTGHNADDIAETVLMNLLRGDLARLQRCTAIKTATDEVIPRSKPFKYTYEKEIVMYAYFKKLDYFSTECIYSPNAYRGYARAFLKDLESIRPCTILDIIHSGESYQLGFQPKINVAVDGVIAVRNCSRCGYMSSNTLCKACVLLEGLNRGLPKLGIGNSDKIRRMHDNKTIMEDMVKSTTAT
ncbi:hypothetical protein BASA50_003712 [Batrachochytrium salamandrivorans]|uniref:Cytoplasmic tRNA 2-thiolation protein 1 n=1 Tax=Batrachochytrium salamandrivorans TaxID=1357716 RepID=A0ABQ8FL59_9FUNG|nr:hypothetical protein BASA62_005035 [Batrachochytrium salamandrivorans]KAH6598677.1 hypothetical protein BASA50_003712 [Batrachochytrium salamandrivorans]